MDETHSLIAQRRAKLDALRAEGVDPFKNKFSPSETCAEARAQYAEGRAVALAGRITSHRDMGKSQFMDLRDQTDRLQIYAQKQVLGEAGWHAEVAAATDLGWPLHAGLELASASAAGHERLTLVFVPVADRGGAPGSHLELRCDLAVLAHRGKPVYDVLYQLGAELELQPELGGYLPAGANRGRTTSKLPGGVDLILGGEAAGRRPGEIPTASEEAARR